MREVIMAISGQPWVDRGSCVCVRGAMQNVAAPLPCTNRVLLCMQAVRRGSASSRCASGVAWAPRRCLNAEARWTPCLSAPFGASRCICQRMRWSEEGGPYWVAEGIHHSGFIYCQGNTLKDFDSLFELKREHFKGSHFWIGYNIWYLHEDNRGRNSLCNLTDK